MIQPIKAQDVIEAGWYIALGDSPRSDETTVLEFDPKDADYPWRGPTGCADVVPPSEDELLIGPFADWTGS